MNLDAIPNDKADLPAQILADLDAALEKICKLGIDLYDQGQIKLSQLARNYFEIRARKLVHAAMAGREDPSSEPIYDMTLARSAPHGAFDRIGVPEEAMIEPNTEWPVFRFSVGVFIGGHAAPHHALFGRTLPVVSARSGRGLGFSWCNFWTAVERAHFPATTK